MSETNSVVSNYLAQLRDITVQGNRNLFRSNLKRIGTMMAYEISKTLDYSRKTILTPLSECSVSTCDDRIVIGTVLRAGLALHEGFMHVFDNADAGFVALFPCVFLILLMLSFNLFGNGLRDAFNPSLRGTED